MAHLLRPVAFGVGRALRETGQAIDRGRASPAERGTNPLIVALVLSAVGSSMMGNYAFKEQLSRHR